MVYRKPMLLLLLILVILATLVCGCTERQSESTVTIQKSVTPTIQTPKSTSVQKNRNVTVDGSLEDVRAMGLEPVLAESELSVSPSANPKKVYLITDGEWIYVGIELYGEFDKSRRYVLNLEDREGGRSFNIKWFPETGFVTDYFVKSSGRYRYVRSYETFGVYKNNTIEIISRCFKVARDFDFASLLVSYPGSSEFEYRKIIFRSEKLSFAIPFAELNFSSTSPLDLDDVTSKAWEVHRSAWKYVTEKAKTDNYFKYGIYASRVLAVRHPEIYLQADRLFVEKITTNEGFRRSYETRDVHSIYLFEREKMTGEPFSFDLVDFGKYRIVPSRAIYPTGYPAFDYIDRRLSPISVTLKTYEDEITELEKVVQLYLKSSGANKYVVYCDNDRAYLWEDGKLIDANLRVTDAIDGNPILIFNEKYVWYPLMERDDSPKDATLKMLVERYSTNVRTPELSDFEAEIVEKLKTVTELKSDEELELAKLSSIRAGVRYFESEWRMIFPDVRNYNTFHSVMKEIIKDGNYLSPIAAYLSAIVLTRPDLNGLKLMCEEYLKHASTNGEFAHGHLWKCGMVEYLIEDAYRARTGHCVSQSANLMAVLNLAGVECYRISAVSVHGIGHDWLYVPKYDVILSNGRMDGFSRVIWITKGRNSMLSGLYHTETAGH